MKGKDKEERANNQALAKRHRKKYSIRRFILALIEANPESPLIKSYWRSYHCCDVLETNEINALISHYCKHRWCFLCNSIRTAVCIHNYEEALSGLKEPYFVTLTARTVVGGDLKERIELFEKEWRKITRVVNNYKKNGKPLFESFKGLRKMECTLKVDDKYHYHYHVIIEGKAQAEWLMAQWLKRMKDARKVGQNIKPANKDSMMELFKYFTKMVDKKERVLSQFKRLDFLFITLRGKRTFQPFGGVRSSLKADEENFTDDLKAKLKRPFGLDGNLWTWQIQNYISEFGEILQDYNPSQETLKMLAKTPKQKGEE